MLRWRELRAVAEFILHPARGIMEQGPFGICTLSSAMPRRFTLAGLLLWVTLFALVLAIVVPLWRYTRRTQMYFDEVVDVAASADGSTFGALLGDGRVLIWDSEGALQGTLHTLGTMGGRLALSFDGKLAAVSPAEPKTWVNVEPRGGVQIWDVATGKVRRSLPVLASSLFFSPAEEFLLVNNGPPWRYEIYSAANDDPPRVVPAGAYPAFSPDGKQIAIGMLANKIQIYDLSTLCVMRELLADVEVEVDYVRVAWAPDGRSMAAMAVKNNDTEIIESWELATGQARRLPLRGEGEGLRPSGWYYTLMYSPDGRRLIVRAGAPGAEVLDSKTLKPIPVGDMLGRWQTAAGLRGDSIVARDKYVVELWDAATILPRQRLYQGPPPPTLWPAAFGLLGWGAAFGIRLSRKRSQARKTGGQDSKPHACGDENSAAHAD